MLRISVSPKESIRDNEYAISAELGFREIFDMNLLLLLK